MKVFEELERRRDWSEDERQLIQSVERICRDVIAPSAAAYDEAEAYPQASMDAINQLGLNAIFVPEAYGGAPMRYRVYLKVVQLISAACASTGIIYATTFHGLKPLIDFGTEDQKQRLLPRIADGAIGALAITEPNAGSDATGMTTSFRPSGDHIVIDGGKIFISNGDVADEILLFGKWSEIDDARASITALILEKGTPGFSIGRTEKKMGHRAAPTVELKFEGARVPKANLIGAPGGGLKLLFQCLNKSRPSIAAHALGIATAAFGDMVAYMNERRLSGRRVIDFQGNQFSLADMATDLAMCELWLDHVAELVESGATDIGVEASMAKMRSTDLAMRIATEAVQMHGGYGYIREFRVERLMRDAKLTQIWEGTNQVHRQLIGRSFADK